MKWNTLQALEASKNEPDKLIAAGEVLDLRFAYGKKARSLSLRASKLLHLLVQIAGVDACADKVHKIAIAELNFPHLSLDDFIDTCRELIATTVRMDIDVKGKKAVKVGPLLSDVERDIDEAAGELRFQLSPVMRLVLARSNHWAALSRQATLAFESRYSLRLYEILSLRKGLDHKHEEVFTIEDLRARLGVPVGKLDRWQDIKRVALEPAIAEVNHLTGLTVRYLPIKQSRSVVSVKLVWGEKGATDRKAVKRELDGHKAGRKARRDGVVETVVSGAVALPAPELSRFPSGKIGFSEWRKVALQELPHPQRDTDLVANEFRAWAASKSLSLDSANIEKVFRGFCRKVEAVR